MLAALNFHIRARVSLILHRRQHIFKPKLESFIYIYIFFFFWRFSFFVVVVVVVVVVVGSQRFRARRRINWMLDSCCVPALIFVLHFSSTVSRARDFIFYADNGCFYGHVKDDRSRLFSLVSYVWKSAVSTIKSRRDNNNNNNNSKNNNNKKMGPVLWTRQRPSQWRLFWCVKTCFPDLFACWFFPSFQTENGRPAVVEIRLTVLLFR